MNEPSVWADAAPATAPADEDGLVLELNDQEAEAQELLDQLDEAFAPSAVERGGKLGGLGGDEFQGLPLPIPYAAPGLRADGSVYVGNPFPRSAGFWQFTNHYAPQLAGDPLHGALATQLEALAGGHEYYGLELRSLVSSASYQFDQMESLRAMAAELASQWAEGTLPEALAHLPKLALDHTVQARSMLQHTLQRIDVLRLLAKPHSEVDLAIMARIYGREERIAGAASDLGAAVRDAVELRTASAMFSIAARERAKAHRAPRRRNTGTVCTCIP